jgi:type I restriction enzyme S subunit
MEAVGNGMLFEGAEKPIGEIGGGYTSFIEGDVLIAKITPSFENGKGALARGLSNGIGFGTTELHVIRPGPGTNPRYMFYMTLSQAFRHPGTGMMQGTAGQQRVPDYFVINFRLPLPPLTEQRAIAAFLDRETARIDALAAKKERLIELLQEKRTALISHAVTKGLNPNVSMKDSGVEWLGEIPGHWEVERLKYGITGCQNGVWGDEPDGVTDVACVRVADFERTRFRVHLDAPTLRAIEHRIRSSHLLHHSDLLLEKSGGGDNQPVGVVVLFDGAIPAVCSNFIARMPSAPGHDANFLCYVHAAAYTARLNSRSIKQNTGIQNLDSEAYLSELGPRPPLDEQRAIAAYLDRETAKIDALVGKVRHAIERLKEYRTALISAAVTGKIDVRGNLNQWDGLSSFRAGD